MAPRYCCINGCASNSTIQDENLRFYSFPSAKVPHKLVRRRQWIKAVIKHNKFDPGWEPKPSHVICNLHFVGGLKSDHPHHPVYNPTVFSDEPAPKLMKLSVDRFERYVRRSLQKSSAPVKPVVACSTSADDFQNYSSKMQESENDTQENENINAEMSVPKFSDFSCQVNLPYPVISNKVDFMMCNLRVENDTNTAETQINLNYIRRFDDKDTLCHLLASPPTEDVACNTLPHENPIKCKGFHGFTSIKCDNELTDLGGVTFAVFSLLLSLIPDQGKTKVKKSNKLLIFLMKLKMVISYSALAVLFCMHRTTVSRIFIDILQCLSIALKNYVYWPNKQAIKLTLPDSFKTKYSNCRAIIDCTEIRIEVPNNVEQKVLFYSNYKSSHTFKFLIACAPNGFITFESKCYGGRASDEFITNDCGFLDLIEPGDVILADKGFPAIKTNMEDRNAIFVMPPFMEKTQFSPEEMEETYKVASVRIHVERCIQRLKLFKVLSHVPTELFPYIDNVVHVCCSLVNLQPPIIQKKQ